jgi:hypothetical protein
MFSLPFHYRRFRFAAALRLRLRFTMPLILFYYAIVYAADFSPAY